MGILKLDSRQRKPLSSVRFVTHKGTSLKIGITTKRGVVGFRMKGITSIGDRPWTPNHLKTTRFIQSNPVVKIKKGEEPPF
jgi:hypothetical protein